MVCFWTYPFKLWFRSGSIAFRWAGGHSETLLNTFCFLGLSWRCCVIAALYKNTLTLAAPDMIEFIQLGLLKETTVSDCY